MIDNPDIHKRRSIRLKNYDYAQDGAYFVTICTQDRECLFGEIVDDAFVHDFSGQMIEKWVVEIGNKFPEIIVASHIVMPNHFHAIFVNTASVGADLRVCPPVDTSETIKGGHAGPPLHRVVQWFKTMTTNEYLRKIKTESWKPFDKRLWQRNYYDHIIRNDEEYALIAEYIENNPKTWKDDQLWKE